MRANPQLAIRAITGVTRCQSCGQPTRMIWEGRDGLEVSACSQACARRVATARFLRPGLVAGEWASMLAGGLVVGIGILVARILVDLWEVIRRG